MNLKEKKEIIRLGRMSGIKGLFIFCNYYYIKTKQEAYNGKKRSNIK
jgi:hypothetical protein